MSGGGGGGVLLGMPGPWANDNREPSDHYTSKIGGLPDWPLSLENLDSDMIQCHVCGGKLCLVAQVYAPISSGDLKIEERVLLLFGCIVPKCGTSPFSWRALRVQKSSNVSGVTNSEREEVPLVPPSVSKNDWLGGLDDDSDDDIDLEALGNALAEAGNLASNSSKPPHKKRQPVSVAKHIPSTPRTRIVDIGSPVVPCFYVYTQEEMVPKDVSSVSLNVSELSIHAKQKDFVEEEASEDYSKEEAANNNATTEGEVYEYDKALAADRTYLKFMKKLDANPEQCFRYSFGGKPLLATDEVGDPGGCILCGALRRYEMQLMPPLIYFLQEAADDCQKLSLSDWNWMTLIIYTCSKSCSGSSSRERSSIGEWIVTEEAVIVQSEKLLHESLQLGYFF